MSQEQQTSQDQTPEPLRPPEGPRIEQTIRDRARVDTLADTLSVMRMDAQNRLVRRLVRKTQDGTVGSATEEPEDTGEEDMNVNVGDTYITNTQPAPAGGVNTQPSGAASGLGRIAGPLLLTGLLGTGLGGVGAGLLMNYLMSRPPATAPVEPGTDADTNYNLLLPQGRPVGDTTTTN